MNGKGNLEKERAIENEYEWSTWYEYMNIWKSNKTQHVAEWSADNNRKTTDEELLKLLEILSFIKVYKTHT